MKTQTTNKGKDKTMLKDFEITDTELAGLQVPSKNDLMFYQGESTGFVKYGQHVTVAQDMDDELIKCIVGYQYLYGFHGSTIPIIMWINSDELEF